MGKIGKPRSMLRVGVPMGSANLLRRQDGSATVQQAVFIALIVGVAFLALDSLGMVTQQTFSNASHGLSGEATPGGDTPGGFVQAKTSTAAQALPAASEGSWLPRWIALALAIPLGALCWYLLYRPERKKQPEADEQPASLPPQSDSEIERDLVFEKRHNLLRLFNADIGMLMTSRILVRHVMSERVHTVSPKTTAEEIRELMHEKNFRHMLVCESNGRLVGLISQRTFENSTGKKASEMMTENPVTVSPTSPLSPAITQLIKQRLYCLPVVDGERLVGVLTTTDVMMAMQCTLHALQKSAHEAVADLPPETVPGFMIALNAEEDTLSCQADDSVGVARV